MKAALWVRRGDPLVVREFATPQVASVDDAVIRVEAAMFGSALLRAITVGHPKLAPPAVLGTLVAGKVVELGGNVQHVRVGDRVTINPHPPCARCEYCRDGVAALCSARPRIDPGGMAEYVRIEPPLTTHLRRVPDGVAVEAAVLTEIVACVLDATHTAQITPGMDVAVLGCGPVAMIQVQAARLAGAGRVICTVSRTARAAIAERFGAIAVDVRQGGAVDRILELTGGRGAHVVVEAVGRAETYELALRVVRAGGTVIGFGGCPPGTRLDVDLNDIHYRRIRLIGSYHYPPGVFDDALNALAAKEIDVAPLITHQIELDQLPAVVDLVREQDCLTVMVRP